MKAKGMEGEEVPDSSVMNPAPQTVNNFHGPVIIHHSHPVLAPYRQCSSKGNRWRCSRPSAEEKNQCQKCIDIRARYRAGAAGKASQARYKSGAAGKAAQKRARNSDKGKVSRKRARNSEKGKEGVKRNAKRRSLVRSSDPAYNLMNKLKTCSTKISAGEIKSDSPTFVARTGFESQHHFRSHMESFFSEENGFAWENYGTKWENEHRIPQIAYDHTDPKDVKRCWSPCNMHPMDPVKNGEKKDKLIDSEIRWCKLEFWPKAWKSKFPDEEEKKRLYAEWEEKKKQAYETANSVPSSSTEPVEEEDESSSEEEEDESSSEEEEGSGFESGSE